MFADDGFINATVILVQLAVASQAYVWAFRFFPPEGIDINAYRDVVQGGPMHFVSIMLFLIFWGIIAGITAIFVSVDFLSFVVTTIVASLAMFAVGKLAFMKLFLTVNFHEARVVYFSENALTKASWLTFLAPLMVAYPLALCFGWVYWVAAGVIAAIAIAAGNFVLDS